MVVALGSLAACGDGEPSAARRDASVYAAAVLWIVDEVPVEGEGDERHVFIESRLADGAIPLAVQADVVNELEGQATVRFVDAREEAVEEDEPRRPVRRGGVLVGLGETTGTGDRARVYADAYVRAGLTRAYELSLTLRGDTWNVVDHERVTPRPAA